MWLWAKTGQGKSGGRKAKTRGQTIGDKLTQRFVRRQRSFADKLQFLTERLSGRNKLLLLIVFGLTGLSLSLHQLRSVFIDQPRQVISISSVRLPSSVHATASSILPKAVINREDRERLRSIHAYVDSLNRTAEGRHELNNLLAQYPGIIDSITKLENIYQSQFQP